ncbi:TIGR03885 family FMN-dependent LLM class oxidoreductase [Roseococcus sp. SYP-B2431]|uniref:TIGR03885 family FMN-dependent LLM class oxidoreductase n=1 Tax=Roseococcus sp. SYP-B2431 TaxID=2496640 RepID=UPI00103C7C38|nr:TIGR03885 family FMN-dependent LLM class oxidoreductase [Roseococcus sp. SYP-B2431]TCH98325.1 TIGR03885 family FMN-dependent LLM class oxidoreductase [Roseococcus sp. SYP-B2431]
MSLRIGFHASHEQFPPSELLDLAQAAEAAGFDCAMSSDHFRPWGAAQGHSGFAWSWLGAALARTRLPIGVISAPGYRYHPAVIAQGAATLAEMFPGRFWLALGSGQRLNEGITGLAWPEKGMRNRRLRECAEVIRALLDGETVTHHGLVTVVEAKLYSRPAEPPLLLGAAVTEETAEAVGAWADGLLTVSADPERMRRVVEAFRRGGGAGKRLVAQVTLNWAPTEAEALAGAHEQWRTNVLGGDVNWELRTPEQFDIATRFVRPEDVRDAVWISADPGWHAGRIAELAEIGFKEVQLHQVGRNQQAFLETFGARVLPAFR